MGQLKINSMKVLTAGQLIDELLSGKYLVKIHQPVNEQEVLQCYKNTFYVSGWGSAYGIAEDRILDIIKNPQDWIVKEEMNFCKLI